jgi:hypothetical protein
MSPSRTMTSSSVGCVKSSHRRPGGPIQRSQLNPRFAQSAATCSRSILVIVRSLSRSLGNHQPVPSGSVSLSQVPESVAARSSHEYGTGERRRQLRNRRWCGRVSLGHSPGQSYLRAAGTDCHRPNESVPARHRIVPGITSVTIPGSKMMARRCFHIVTTSRIQTLFEQSDSGSANSCSLVR